MKTLPIIAVTSKVDQGERQRCVDAGANDYVPKPFDTEVFLTAIELWLAASAARAIPSTPGAVPGSGPLVTPAPAVAGYIGESSEQRLSDLHEFSALAGLKILVVDDDVRNVFAMTALLERGEANVIVAKSGADALAELEREPEIDIALMDIMMPIMDGYETMRAIRAIDRFASLPIIAVTGKAAADERQRCIDAGASDYLPKPVDSAELLATLWPWLPDATEGRLHVVPAESIADQAGPSVQRHGPLGASDTVLNGVQVLVVDDDFRTIFAMTSLLERSQATVTVAESGVDALAALKLTPDIDIVLMDILMPGMDGYETIRAIRAFDSFSSLPVIAFTGKAAAGERQRCLDAGASDYIPNPVNTAELLAALRPWLPTSAQTVA